ncbi:TRAP transporter permease [Chloroflexota bacterium]
MKSNTELQQVDAASGTAQYRKQRTLGLSWSVFVAILTAAGLCLAINQIFILGYFGRLQLENAYLFALIACCFSLVFIIFPATKRASSRVVPWYDILLCFLTIFVSIYLVTQSWNIIHKGWQAVAPVHIGIIAIVFCLLVAEGLRRTGGLVLFIICAFFAVYPIFADYMPGLLRGAQFSPWDTVLAHVLSYSSIMGIVAHLFGYVLFGFLLFGTTLMAAGGAKAFMHFALALLGNQKGGPAKVSVVSSGLFGSLTGSVISNIITTGSFTIPAMKKAGYPGHLAGAIETVASTGGSIMPPVMGTVGFLIASFLQMDYFQVALAALIPALLYYFALFMQVHGYAAVHNLKGIERSQLPSLKAAFKEVWPYLFSILALVYFLYLGLAGRAPFAASVVLIILAMLRKGTRLRPKDFFKLLIDTGRLLAYISGILLGIGFIIGTFTITGIGNSFAHEIGMLAGENIILLLFLGAIGSLVLGMGMPVIACYIFLAIIIAPPLINAGLNPLAVHLFVMYWGMSSYLTPPVALGAYAAAGIADSNPNRTALQSMRLGILIYILPFCFIFSPALVLQASLLELLLPLTTLVLGVVLLTAALEGYLVKFGNVSPYYRLPLGISGLLLAIPGMETDIIGIFIGVLIIGVLLFLKKRRGTKEFKSNKMYEE